MVPTDHRSVAPGSVVLVVGEATDAGAWAAVRAAAHARPDLDVRWVPAPLLARARWSHRVDADGTVRTRVTLPAARPASDGAPSSGADVLTDDDLALVWLRAEPGVPAALRGAAEADASYGAAELHALVVSWLLGLGDRAVNVPDGDGAAGPAWSPWRWRALARSVGLDAPDPVEATSARLVDGWRGHPWDARRPLRVVDPPAGRILVAGSVVVGARSPEQADGVRRLAKAVGCRVLTVLLDADGAVVGVEPRAVLVDAADVEAAAAFLAEVAS